MISFSFVANSFIFLFVFSTLGGVIVLGGGVAAGLVSVNSVAREKISARFLSANNCSLATGRKVSRDAGATARW